MTQRDLAARVSASPAHIAYIENGGRNPSSRMLARLAAALHLEMRLLASHAYPKLRELFDSGNRKPPPKLQAWREFTSGYHNRHNVTEAEQRVLYEVNKLGRVRSARDFVHIIETIRLSLEEPRGTTTAPEPERRSSKPPRDNR